VKTTYEKITGVLAWSFAIASFCVGENSRDVSEVYAWLAIGFALSSLVSVRIKR
jgi:hypothetical protein